MWGGKPIAMLLIMSMLSACAGSHAPEVTGENEPEPAKPMSYADAVETRTVSVADRDDYLLERSALVAAHHADERRYARERYAHQHSEPTPEQKAVAETVLLVTASVFVCTFVVVVLDGACEFGAHAGYYY